MTRGIVVRIRSSRQLDELVFMMAVWELSGKVPTDVRTIRLTEISSFSAAAS